MPFTLIHGFIGYLAIALFTKDRKLRWLGLLGGLVPDIDAIPFIYSIDLYLQIHKTLHPVVFGLAFGIVLAFASERFFRVNRIWAGAAFMAGFFLHLAADLIFTDWPIKLFWPFSQESFIYPFLSSYQIELNMLVTALLLVFILHERRGKNTNNLNSKR